MRNTSFLKSRLAMVLALPVALAAWWFTGALALVAGVMVTAVIWGIYWDRRLQNLGLVLAASGLVVLVSIGRAWAFVPHNLALPVWALVVPLVILLDTALATNKNRAMQSKSKQDRI